MKTTYNPTYIEEVYTYLQSTGRENTKLPTIEGFAGEIGVHRDTIYEWEKNNPDFADALEQLRAAQKQQLMDDGLYGGKEVNSSMAIFLLKCNHGMIETSHTDITTNGKTITGPTVYLPQEEHGK